MTELVVLAVIALAVILVVVFNVWAPDREEPIVDLGVQLGMERARAKRQVHELKYLVDRNVEAGIREATARMRSAERPSRTD